MAVPDSAVVGGGGMAEHDSEVVGGGGIAVPESAVFGGGAIDEHDSAVVGGAGMAELDASVVRGGGGMAVPDSAVLGGAGMAEHDDSAVFGGGGITEGDRTPWPAGTRPGRGSRQGSSGLRSAASATTPADCAALAPDSIVLMLRPVRPFCNYPGCKSSPQASGAFWRSRPSQASSYLRTR